MFKIVCTGDSHTWGQGVPGLLESFSPPIVAGEKRLVPFRFPCYVNLLREYANKKYSGFASEAVFPDMPAAPRLALSGAELWRVQYRVGLGECCAEIVFGGELVLPDGAELYRIESYFGGAAVLNGGVGSCPQGQYLDSFWGSRVEAARPDLVVVEPCSINDWIEGLGPDESRRRTCETFARISALGARALLLTVSPIAGEQIRNGFNYGDYIAASREAASACGVPIADANAKMTKLLAGLNPSEARKLLYSDDWHVNALGHRLYAEEIIGLRLI